MVPVVIICWGMTGIGWGGSPGSRGEGEWEEDIGSKGVELLPPIGSIDLFKTYKYTND